MRQPATHLSSCRDCVRDTHLLNKHLPPVVIFSEAAKDKLATFETSVGNMQQIDCVRPFFIRDTQHNRGENRRGAVRSRALQWCECLLALVSFFFLGETDGEQDARYCDDRGANGRRVSGAQMVRFQWRSGLWRSACTLNSCLLQRLVCAKNKEAVI